MNELTIYTGVVNPFDEALKIGETFAKSGFFGCDRKEAGTILALACIVEGRSPFEMANRFHILGGKLSKKSSAVFSDFRSRGGKVKWLKTGDDGKEAEAEFTFEGQTITCKFTMEDAIRAQLVKKDGGWTKTPGNMLRARCLTNAIGMLCPEIFSGESSGDDEPASEAKQLLQSDAVEIKQAKIKPSPATAPTIINVEQVATQPADVVEVKPEPAPATPPTRHVATANPKTGTLSPQTVEALIAVIGDENSHDADKWFQEKKWIIPMGSIANLSVARAQSILNNPTGFIETVKRSKVEGGAK